MLGSFRKTKNNILVWALLVMLIIGLAGFGIGAGGGISSQNVARVGDTPVPSDSYIRALQQELRALTAQTGRSLTMAEAREYGFDRIVLARLINDAALDGEAGRLGLSIGDEAVRAEVVDAPSFRGSDGKFDREAYAYALDRIGLRPAEFEDLLRRENARGLITDAVAAAAIQPERAALTVLGFLGERRSFDWLRIDAATLPDPIPSPTDADLQAEHDEHEDRYTRPETLRIAYAAIDPETLAAEIEIPEDDLRAAYDAGVEHFRTPERRALDRIGFGTMEEAETARAAIDTGETDFDAVAAARGLSPQETDLGLVAKGELSDEAGAVVFAADGPGIVGPITTPLGPAIFRVNGIVAARTTPFEEAEPQLRSEKALAEAKIRIAEDAPHIEDLIAGGATVEEIASETVMQLDEISLNSETAGGLADDPAFRAAATDAETGIETDIVQLANGGLASLRVEAVEPPTVLPLEDVRDRVAADWTEARTAEALTAVAEGYVEELNGGLDFAALAERIGVPAATAGPMTRGDTLPGAPADLVAEVFAAGTGDAVVVADGAGVTIARVTSVAAFDPETEDNAAVVESLQSQLREQTRGDLVALFTAAIRDAEGVTTNPSLIESTLARFP